jgi:hypothetical protein
MNNVESSNAQKIKKDALNNVENLSAEDIMKYIRMGIATLDEFRATGNLDASKRKRVQSQLAVFELEDTDFNNADTIKKLTAFKEKYPESEHVRTGKADEKIARIQKGKEDTDFNNADTVEKLEAFKEKYPESEYARTGKADEKIARMKTAEEDNDFNNTDTLEKLEAFAKKYPNSGRIHDVYIRIEHIKMRMKEEENARMEAEQREREERINVIIRNINAYTPGLFKQQYGEDVLRYVCWKIGIPYEIVDDYDEPALDFDDKVPEKEKDIPSEYTDIFFWGVPSSGKSCALSAILNTIRQKYTMDDPVKTDERFGAEYRHSLARLFSRGENNDIAYLPSATNLDRTQYMPFRFRRRNEEENRYRNVSFFELSGEIFKCFYDIVNRNVSNGGKLEEDLKNFAFNTLQLLLRCRNQKVHFFFIDYNQSKQKRQEQMEYLGAAATYFNSIDDIFKDKTKAVYVVVTKADEITRPNGTKAESDEERSRLAEAFLGLNFGGFIDVIQKRCKTHSVPFGASIFSIGDVYFSKICRINRKYSIDIVEDLLEVIQPPPSRLRGWFEDKLIKS